jgi:hypothetical protein
MACSPDLQVGWHTLWCQGYHNRLHPFCCPACEYASLFPVLSKKGCSWISSSWFAQLAYTRGTSIPLSLTLRCADRQALDIFYTTSQTPSSSPPALAVRLLRHVSAHPAAAAKVRSGYFDPLGRSKSFDQPRGKSRPMGQTDWNVVTTVVEGASFWPVSPSTSTWIVSHHLVVGES